MPLSSHSKAIQQGVIVVLTLLFQFGLAHAETIEHKGATFWVYRLDLKKGTLQLFLAEEKGKPQTFKDLEARLNKQGKQLKLALNSGIYEPTFLFTGLHISERKTIVPLTLRDYFKKRPDENTPNVFLKPNGVFFIRPDKTAGVLESHAYAKSGEKPILATQSGPMLLGDGRIHPAFNEPSKSRLIRNGVGVTKDGTVILVCSDRTPNKGQINLYGFAELFRDKLNCPNALYLDGDISHYFQRNVTGPIPDTNWFAGILAIVEEKK